MIDEALARRCLAAFAPPPKIDPVIFAESEIVLPSSANAIPGPLRLARYQREMVASIADDDCEIIVFMLSAQTGKSLSVDVMLSYCIVADPGPMLHIAPNEEDSKKFVNNRFNPLIATTPALRERIGRGQTTGAGRAGGVDSVSSKTYPGGQVDFGSSFKPGDMAARSIKYLFLDEVDRFNPLIRGEGEPVAIALKRTKTYENKGRKVLLVSTPTVRSSRINQWYLSGDQRKFHVTCPDCGHCAPLEFGDPDKRDEGGLKWDAGKPQTAQYMCDECGVLHDEAAKRAMVDGGEWRATAQGEPGIRSYHLNELASVFSSLQSVASQYETAKKSENLQAFYNTTLAQTFDSDTEVELDASELQQRAEPIKPPYSSDIAFITAGVDVQGDWLECTFLAHHTDQTKSVLGHVRRDGSTLDDEVWRAIDADLETGFPLADGRKLMVAATAVDSGGHRTDQVIRFVDERRRKNRRTFAIKGMAGFDRQSLKWGGKLKDRMRLLIVGVDAVKHALQSRLSMTEVGPGYIRLPDHLGREYCESVASEELTTKRVNGVTKQRYKPIVKRNEAWDCLVYAYAIAGAVPAHSLTTPAKPELDLKEQAARLHAALNPN